MSVMCIYHGNCVDGFGAAWVVNKYFKNLSFPVEFHAAIYGNPAPDVRGKKVIMVDFSYPAHVIEQMAIDAKSLLILDHHKSAQESLHRLPYAGENYNQYLINRQSESSKVFTLFDMHRSGAGMAWDFFFPNEDRPALISHIEDRDLWKFELTGTREIMAAVFSHQYDFEVWDRLMLKTSAKQLYDDGFAIERKLLKDVNELLGLTKRTMTIGGIDVPVANLPYTMASEAGNVMAKDQPFAATYYDTDEFRVFSLRSDEDGLDVSHIAGIYGGGGHMHSAGFRVERGWEGDLA